nr:putative ribonuclease H-like domain-containing protein [Tanacetum cinerariifolium]
NADNLDQLAELQALQKQEQVEKEEVDRLGLAFPNLNPMLGVGTSSVSSSVSAGSTPSVSASSTPQIPTGSTGRLVSAGRPTGSAGRPVSAGRPHGSAGRPVSAGRPHGSAGRPVSAGRPSGSADRSSVPAGHILRQSNAKSSLNVSSTITKRIHNIHPTSQVIGDINFPVHTRSQVKHKGSSESSFISYIHDQRRNNHLDFQLSKIKAIPLFLAFASFIGYKVYQMDVKSAFLYGKIAEEVYVTQPKGFEDPNHPKRVYKVIKALYGLHQALRAWYERLSTFLLKHRYRRGSINQTIFIKKDSNDIMLVQVYVDDIIFSSTRKDWCEEFKTLMQSEFEMSTMGPLTFFLGLQVDQRPNGIFIHQEKYVADILKKFDLDNSKLASTPFEPQKIREKNVLDEPISVHLYRSMIGCLMYLTATRPNIVFAVCAAARHQVTPKTSNILSVKRIFKYLTAYPKLGLCVKSKPLLLTPLVKLNMWLLHHAVVRDANEKKLIQVLKIPTENNVADLLTKSFDVTRFSYLVDHIVVTIHFISAGHVIFCWLLVISAGHKSFLLVVPFSYWYALTANPTINASLVRQFWGSASEVSLPDSVKGLEATIDGTSYTVTEASIRSALHLDDLNAIDTLTNAEIFDGLRAIGYATEGKFTFFKNKFSPQWKFLIHTLIHCISPKSGSWNQFASNIAIAFICLSTGRKYNFSNMIFNGMCHNVSSRTMFLMQSLPSPIPFGPAPSSSVASTDPILEIPSSSRLIAPVLETITFLIRDDDTGGGSFPERPTSPSPATLSRSPTVGVAEEPLTLNSLLALDAVVLFAKRIKKLESKLKSKKRKLVLSDSENEEDAR